MKSGSKSGQSGAGANTGTKLPVVHRFTAQILGDYRQEHHEDAPMARHHLRGLLILAVFALVIAFTALKYTTDDGLRASTVTQRHTDVGGLSAETVETAYCPCRNTTLLWGQFLNFTGPFGTSDFEAATAQCRNLIAPGSGMIDPNNITASIAALDFLSKNRVNLVVCTRLFGTIFQSIDKTERSVTLGFGENYDGTQLKSLRQLNQSVNGWVGGLYYRSAALYTETLTLQTLQNFQYDPAVTALRTANNITQTQLATLLAGLNASTTVVDEMLTALQTYATSANNAVIRTARKQLTIDYPAYMDACAPFYCDVTEVKSVAARISEFLGLVGGLWATFCGLAITGWALLGKLGPLNGHRPHFHHHHPAVPDPNNNLNGANMAMPAAGGPQWQNPAAPQQYPAAPYAPAPAPGYMNQPPAAVAAAWPQPPRYVAAP